jgi:N6-adenosine-specific RNA methylase IME4
MLAPQEHLDIDALHAAIEAARTAMRTAIGARQKPDIVHIFAQVRHIHAEVAGAEKYFAEAGNVEAQRRARGERLGAEYLMGQWLIKLEAVQLRYTGRPGKGVRIGTPPDPSLITLDDLGVSRIESQLWQAVAKLTAEEFAALLVDDTATSSIFRQIPESRPSSLGALKFHPLANIFPLMEGPEFAALVADIKANGQREPIVLFEDKVLDGRNRWRACKKAGVEPKTKEYRGKDPLAFVISLNLRRRHLDESQRSMVAAKLATLGEGRPSKTSSIELVSQDTASTMLNVGVASIKRARTVLEKGTDELKHAVEQGHIAVSLAAKAAELPKAQQREIVKQAEAGNANVVRNVVKKAARADREQKVAAKIEALPDRKYGVILADPQWGRTAYSDETGRDRDASNHYPTATTGDEATQDNAIKALDVGSIAARDCVLGLWCTDPHRGVDVMRAWDFKPVSYFVWVKDIVEINEAQRAMPGVTGLGRLFQAVGAAGTGFWNRDRDELMLIGVRGHPVCPALGTQGESVWFARRGEHATSRADSHSDKPDCAQEWFERHWPHTPKVELNARRRRAGWDAWGPETPTAEARREGADARLPDAPSPAT